MRSCHSCNIRVLVAIVCGLLTGVILGLGIWRLAVRIQRGVSTSVSSTPIQFCRNGGTWQNGRCICTEEWKGLRCTIANFCENSTDMGFTFGRIPVGRYGPSLQTCPEGTVNAGNPKATRLCNVSDYGEIMLQNVMIGSCTENLETLETQIEDITTESKNISTEAQILTADASILTPENITSATRVVGQIFNETRGAESQAKRVAITTVSQILDASEDVFQRAAEIDNEDSFSTLIEQMESYSYSLGDETVVEPNVAIQSVTRGSDSGSSVLFSVQKGVPAIVVGVTVGAVYAQSGNKSNWELDYRQEEICWLAIPKSDNFVKSPFLWSFIVPVTIILISNIAIFIIITVKVLWKNNQNLTSTKKVSSLKKILSTLSIAVVFGVTWILAYAMLINNDDVRIVFSYIFCLFNTTQGLQIFILYTVRTKVFQSEASKVLKSLSSSFDRVKPLPSMTPLRLRVRMYNMLRVIPSLHERFRLLEPSGMTEETSLS
ncbi:adhesion G protein-coupled receptor G7 [Cricetulus griseus]